jgi:hypothetical protein
VSYLFLPLVCALLGGGAPLRAETPKGRDSSHWRPLFNGMSLDGWEHV